MNTKKHTLCLTIFLFVALVLVTISKTNAFTSQAVGYNCLITIPATGSLQFQNDINKTVTLTVSSGLLNSTTNTVKIYDGGGFFRFISLNDSEVEITYTVDNVKVNGEHITSGSSVSFASGTTNVIEWDLTLTPMLPFMFIFGMIGLGSMIGGPLYAIHLFKQREYYNGFVYGLVITVLGFALFIAWLWA